MRLKHTLERVNAPRMIQPTESTTVRKHTIKCSEPGCHNSTSERKPYCYKHVDRMPYCRKIIRELNEMNKQLALISKKGWTAVDCDGYVCREILSIMLDKQVCSAKLIRRLRPDISEKVIKACLIALKKAGRATSKARKRNGPLYKLVDA